MKHSSKIFILSLLSCLAVHLHAQTPKYIFYFIGDGFGLNQSILAENYLDALQHKTEGGTDSAIVVDYQYHRLQK